MLRDAASENHFDALVLYLFMSCSLPQNMFVVIMKIVCNSHLMVVICNVECVHVSFLELDRPPIVEHTWNKEKDLLYSKNLSKICVRFEFFFSFIHWKAYSVHTNTLERNLSKFKMLLESKWATVKWTWTVWIEVHSQINWIRLYSLFRKSMCA